MKSARAGGPSPPPFLEANYEHGPRVENAADIYGRGLLADDEAQAKGVSKRSHRERAPNMRVEQRSNVWSQIAKQP
jgi:hypothetical protein